MLLQKHSDRSLLRRQSVHLQELLSRVQRVDEDLANRSGHRSVQRVAARRISNYGSVTRDASTLVLQHLQNVKATAHVRNDAHQTGKETLVQSTEPLLPHNRRNASENVIVELRVGLVDEARPHDVEGVCEQGCYGC